MIMSNHETLLPFYRGKKEIKKEARGFPETRPYPADATLRNTCNRNEYTWPEGKSDWQQIWNVNIWTMSEFLSDDLCLAVLGS